VGVELLNDEVQCVHFGCGVELNRFFTIDSNNSKDKTNTTLKYLSFPRYD